jgi:hypothetical protein
MAIGRHKLNLLWLLTLSGLLLVCYSFSLDAYTDNDRFYERYMQLSSGQSDAFFKLRDEMLTPKYRIFDSGITLILASQLALLLLKLGRGDWRAPTKKGYLWMMAILLPVISVVGYVFDLVQGSLRDEFPHWADSLGIPLMGVPVQLGFLLMWAIAHMSLSRGCNQLGTPLARARLRWADTWLILVAGATLLMVISCLFFGQYWYAIPAMLWLYFYLSLMAIRVDGKSQD